MVAPCILRFLIPFGRFSIIGIRIASDLPHVVCNFFSWNGERYGNDNWIGDKFRLYSENCFGVVSCTDSRTSISCCMCFHTIFARFLLGIFSTSPFFVVVDLDFEINNLQVFLSFKRTRWITFRGPAWIVSWLGSRLYVVQQSVYYGACIFCIACRLHSHPSSTY